MLATSVPVIAALDPKRAAPAASSGGDLSSVSPELLDAVLSASDGATAAGSSSAEATAGKGASRRRKA